MLKQQYKILNDIEHVLKRPDMYVGGKDVVTSNLYLFKQQIKEEECTYSPILTKLFDEAIVNAFDHVIRCEMENLQKVSLIEIKVNETSFSIKNDGEPIPTIEQDSIKGKIPVPEMIFGHVRSGENFNDAGRITGGKNGYGIKLCNIFSTKFTVHIVNAKEEKEYKQSWKKNMTVGNGTFKTKKTEKKASFVDISFYPDFERMGIPNIDENMIAFIHRRAMDITACLPYSIKVKFNGKLIPTHSLSKYGKLIKGVEHLSSVSETTPFFEVMVGVKDRDVSDICFVNGIHTMNGGTHLNWARRQLYNLFKSKMPKKLQPLLPSIQQFSDRIFFLIRMACVDPSFDAQTKTKLTTIRTKWGFDHAMSEKAMSKFITTAKLKTLFETRSNLDEKMKETDGAKKIRITGIKKLNDAEYAGTYRSNQCMLILCEGDSAGGAFDNSIPIELQKYIGLYKLRGKILNTRKANDNLILKNNEIQELKKILGLKNGIKYDQTTIKNLRYGKLIIATDADVDGIHIRGLVINFFDHFWPELLDLGFIHNFYTPIVIFTKEGKKVNIQEMFTDHEMKKWIEENGGKIPSGWKYQYYKGLGTNTKQDMSRYMKKLPEYVKTYLIDTKKDHEMIQYAYEKDTEWRKKQILEYNPNDVISSIRQRKDILYNEFLTKELNHFQFHDVARHIPNLMDGFTPSQRKVLHTMMKKNIYGKDKSIKIVQLTGMVMTETCYHHGDASMNKTICKMAASYTGANNLSLLFPSGSFGSRMNQAMASPRYILTYLRDYTSLLFPHEPVGLEFQREDDQIIEPVFYAPILPMVLVNGVYGIGTGFSTFIPPFSVQTIITALGNLLRGNMENFRSIEFVPNWRGFTGKMEEYENGDWEINIPFTKEYKKMGKETFLSVQIEDMLPDIDFVKLKIHYEKLMEDGDIFDFNYEYWDDEEMDPYQFRIRINVLIKKGTRLDDSEKEMISALKLRNNICMSNIHLISPQTNRIRKYNTIHDIILEYYPIRLEIYEKRRLYLVSELKNKILVSENKIRFIEMVNRNEIHVLRRKKHEIEDELNRHQFYQTENGYSYLLAIRYLDITDEMIKKLESSLQEDRDQLKYMESVKPEKMWLNELKKLYDAIPH